MFYVVMFFVIIGKIYVYKIWDIENGLWQIYEFVLVLYDNLLFFDDDGCVYMIYGGGKIFFVEFKVDVLDIKLGGIYKVIIENVNKVFGESEFGGLLGEGL